MEKTQSDFQLVALTLPGIPDAAIAIAASLPAGGIGVLDLEFVQDEKAALASAGQLRI